MYNPIDSRQIRALIEYRKEQVSASAGSIQQVGESRRRRERRVVRIRVAIGTGLIRVGAKIAGMYEHDLPRLSAGA